MAIIPTDNGALAISDVEAYNKSLANFGHFHDRLSRLDETVAGLDDDQVAALDAELKREGTAAAAGMIRHGNALHQVALARGYRTDTSKLVAIDPSRDALALASKTFQDFLIEHKAHGKPPGKPALTDREREVLDLIEKESANGGAIPGKAIVKKLVLEQSTLTTRIIPVLKLHGVRNRKGAGYYIDTGAANAR